MSIGKNQRNHVFHFNSEHTHNLDILFSVNLSNSMFYIYYRLTYLKGFYYAAHVALCVEEERIQGVIYKYICN